MKNKRSFAHVIVDLLGYSFDPHGGFLPNWKAKAKPVAHVPKMPEKPEPNARQVNISDVYTDDELDIIANMTEHEFGRKRHLFGHYKTGAEFVRDYRERQNGQSKTATIDFTANIAEHNISPREYGEMLAYKPPLTDLKIASAIKTELVKRNFKNHKDIVEVLKGRFPEITLQKVKHHSSAFQNAMDNQ